MEIMPIESIPAFHSVPHSDIHIRSSPNTIIILVDSEKEERICLRFSPYQAIRVTTDDCFSMRQYGTFPFARLCIIHNSLWKAELKRVLQSVDHNATFLDDAKHFILFTTEGAIEIVA